VFFAIGRAPVAGGLPVIGTTRVLVFKGHQLRSLIASGVVVRGGVGVSAPMPFRLYHALGALPC
jgi:hypothetical protein